MWDGKQKVHVTVPVYDAISRHEHNFYCCLKEFLKQTDFYFDLGMRNPPNLSVRATVPLQFGTYETG
jgi:hypothetical protein